MIYYVIHSGRGTDGGFGDYSPPYWSADPVSVDGRTIWFSSESEADAAVKALNKAAADAFYGAGHGGSYTGDFPVEYEWRKIVKPTGAASDIEQAVALVALRDGDTWTYSSWGSGCDCEDTCPECGDQSDWVPGDPLP